MKITKRQLKRIIKEEKQKLLAERMHRPPGAGSTNPVANAERSLGMYANAGIVDQLNKTVAQLLENIVAEAIEDGLEDDESHDLAVDALVMAVHEAFLNVGMADQAQGLIYMLSKGNR